MEDDRTVGQSVTNISKENRVLISLSIHRDPPLKSYVCVCSLYYTASKFKFRELCTFMSRDIF